MKRFGGLFERVVSLANLWQAWRAFIRGKRRRPDVLRFAFDADRHVLRLRRALVGGAYRPGGYRLRLIHEPKRRLIAAAAVRDRVVHHAVHRVLAPLLDRGLVDHTYACLDGRGSHRAVLAFRSALLRHRHVLLLDVRRYFLSIDRRILIALMARRLKEAALVELLRRIAESGAGLYRRPEVAAALDLPVGFPPEGCGLPIGNLTSQWWANHYLSGLDHFVKRELKVPHAQRYMDDIALFADDRRFLYDARERIRDWLAAERRLSLKDPQARVRSARERCNYLGYRVSRAGIDLLPATLRRMQRRLRGAARCGDEEALARKMASYRGLLFVP